ncbi:MAG: hypothetical protein KC585_00890 [Candidatus Magasanikbacteria bacterium]|nr:hypothetical protein [Candidatus Magasanikbacteria bacterium]
MEQRKKVVIIALCALTGALLLLSLIFFLRGRNPDAEEWSDSINQTNTNTPVTSTPSVTGSPFLNGANYQKVMYTPESNREGGDEIHTGSNPLGGDDPEPFELVDQSEAPDAVIGGVPDSDSDTISDVDEARYGTDPLKADTDGDGFNDADEIKNGYNPLGEGRCAVSTCIIN